jgi:hypothetical protein
MLIPCPECERKVSDRAKACPECGFPVSDWVAERAAAERLAAARASRERVGETDCPSCEARGFVNFSETTPEGETRELFSWCVDCRHSGRVHQCRDSEGYYAVSYAAFEAFLSGELDGEAEGVHFLGTEAVTEHRYPQAGRVYDEDEGGDD